jgi:hypothetical protein
MGSQIQVWHDQCKAFMQVYNSTQIAFASSIGGDSEKPLAVYMTIRKSLSKDLQDPCGYAFKELECIMQLARDNNRDIVRFKKDIEWKLLTGSLQPEMRRQYYDCLRASRGYMIAEEKIRQLEEFLQYCKDHK